MKDSETVRSPTPGRFSDISGIDRIV